LVRPEPHALTRCGKHPKHSGTARLNDELDDESENPDRDQCDSHGLRVADQVQHLTPRVGVGLQVRGHGPGRKKRDA
jgi:hypothetical protein